MRSVFTFIFLMLFVLTVICTASNAEAQKLNQQDVPLITTSSSYIDNINIRWKNALNAERYQVRYAKQEDMTGSTVLETKEPKIDIVNLQKGNDYYLQVRALNADSWTEWSPVKKVRTASFSASVTTYNSLSATAKVQPEYAWNLRKDAFKEIVMQKNNNPDIIAFQESTQMAGELVDMFDQYYDSHVSAREASSARVISWKREKFKLVSFNDDEDIFGSEVTGGDGARYITQVRLKEIETGKELMVFSIHVPASTNKPREEGQRIRNVGATNLAKYVKEQEKKFGIPAIVVGDFNNYPKTVINGLSSAAMVLVENGFQDTFDEALTHTNENYSTTLDRATSSVKVGLNGSKRIDYIFTYPADQVSVSDYSIIINFEKGSTSQLQKPVPSDHHPVRAVLHFTY